MASAPDENIARFTKCLCKEKGLRVRLVICAAFDPVSCQVSASICSILSSRTGGTYSAIDAILSSGTDGTSRTNSAVNSVMTPIAPFTVPSLWPTTASFTNT